MIEQDVDKKQKAGSMDGDVWLSIFEYARLKNISVSTVRRYIKSKKLSYKNEKGKFLIFIPKEQQQFSDPVTRELIELKIENENLKFRLRKMNEEINDLKMLVKAYEINEKNEQQLPELPI